MVLLLECAALRSLTLTQCKALYNLQAESSAALQSLNLFGCRNVGPAALEALLRVAAPPVESARDLARAAARHRSPPAGPAEGPAR